ncbi:MAG TPA: ATPase domain-containing protein [Nitrosopumilaceae archaeon]|nr:ATPase domain-containing protein [Nitrosopumilaceae archaeon]
MIPTSIEKLDHFLGGGIKNGIITDIFGPNGTGKTQFLIQISINSLLQGGHVYFQDTTGEFRPERMLQVMQNNNMDYSLMNNVLVSRITNSAEQIQALSKIPKSNFDLIVIDNITDLYSFEYSKDELTLEKNIIFMKYMHDLSKITIQNNISTVITNMIRNIDHHEIENLEKSINMFTHTKIKLSKHGSKFSGKAYSPFSENSFNYNISSLGLTNPS